MHNDTIQDGYEGNLTIRRLEILEKEIPGRIFGERIVMLESINPEIAPFEVNVVQKGEVEVVGTLYK